MPSHESVPATTPPTALRDPANASFVTPQKNVNFEVGGTPSTRAAAVSGVPNKSFTSTSSTSSSSPPHKQLPTAARGAETPTSPAAAPEAANFSFADWTPEQGLPGMEFDPANVDDPIRSMKVMEMLQALDRTTEELMGTKVSNEELMGFLEMGEKRIVDLAVKVKLLEDRNEKMEATEQAQKDAIARLQEHLSELRSVKQQHEGRLEEQEAEIGALRDNNHDLSHSLDVVSTEKAREYDRVTELRRLNDDQEELLRKERERAEGDRRVVAATADREKKRINEKSEEWHRKSDMHHSRAKQLEKDLKDKTREVEKFQSELTGLQRQYKNERSRMDNELQNGKMKNQEEMVRLHTWDKELSELSEKLKKGEAKLDKEKTNIKRSLADAVTEIQAQRQSENHLLIDMKAQYEAELASQFELRQAELDEHWRQKESLELEQLEERRNNLDAELQLKMQKAGESRQRLERYSGNLERYGRRLKAEYDNWQHEKQQVYIVLDEAQHEREEIEVQHKVKVDELMLANRALQGEVQAKQAQLDSLNSQLGMVTDEREKLTQAQQQAEEREEEAEKRMEQLTEENDRLVEDNTILEKNFNELKSEHDQLLEEMTYMRSREEEERELRRKTNEMLLASYKIKNPQTGMVVPMTTKAGQVVEGIDLLCWKCHSNVLEDEGSGLLARTKEARQQMQELTQERKLLHSEKEVFLKAHKLDALKLADETATIRDEREALRRDTENLIAERKAIADASVGPKNNLIVQNQRNRIDPDTNPIEAVTLNPHAEPPVDASKRRKKDLMFLKSVYTGPQVNRNPSHVPSSHVSQGSRWGNQDVV